MGDLPGDPLDPADPVGILESVSEIALELSTIAKLLNEEEKAKEEFTQRTRDKLLKKYPALNVMVVHPSFTQTFIEPVTHVHYELPLHGNRTNGYEIYTFRAGDFWLQGDGGYENWAFGGNFVRDGGHVTFHDRPVPQTPPTHPPHPPQPPKITDGVYLVNSYKGDQQSSGLAWYRSALDADGHQPDAYIDIAQSVYYWEGKVSSGTFKDGNTFNCLVNADAHTKAQDALVGMANNNFRPFSVYKDNFRVLYTVDGWEVRTVYRCV